MKPLLLLVGALALQACGGGGGGDDKPPAPSGLSYSTPQTYTVGTAITALSPTVTGDVTGYTVTPSLPAGLALSASTGQISGTPTAPVAATTYTVTASNAGGNTAVALSLTVLLERGTADRADEKTGQQVHVLYVLPSDGADQQLDTLGKIEGSVRAWNKWFGVQTGGPVVRLDTYGGGRLDVTFLRLARTDAAMNIAGGNVRDKLEYSLLASGFDSVDKIYLVYYGGTGDACGRGAWPPVRHGNVAALYLLSTNCPSLAFAGENDAPGYWDFLSAHEALHGLGFAASCAPHHSENGHVTDSPADVLYSSPVANSAPWAPATLDVNHDDYFAASNAGCPDLSASEFLEPLPASAVPPPGWPYHNLTNDGCSTEATVIPGPLGADTQVTFVNNYGAGTTIEISERVLSGSVYVRSHRINVAYPEGAVLAVKANAVLVASVGTTCTAVVRAANGPSRFVIKP